MSAPPLRLAMWSGPRNISTALMRSWDSRPDTFVCDEPLYAHYLHETGYDHPGGAETVAAHETDWRKVVAWLTGPIPAGKTVFYQKQMAHHLLPHVEGDWLDELSHCFLIRNPRDMLTSLLEFLPQPRVEDTGLPQQARLFERIAARGETPPVIDAKDVLLDPPRILRQLCERVGVQYADAMLSWPPGFRETDGAWAPFWYKKIEHTTGFAPYREKNEDPPAELSEVLAQCERLYARLYEERIR